jgi:hypothetical protein
MKHSFLALGALAAAIPFDSLANSTTALLARDPQPDNGISQDQGASDMQITMWGDMGCIKGASHPMKVEYGVPLAFDQTYYGFSLSRKLQPGEQLDVSDQGQGLGPNVGDCGHYLLSITNDALYSPDKPGGANQFCTSASSISINCVRLWKNKGKREPVEPVA